MVPNNSSSKRMSIAPMPSQSGAAMTVIASSGSRRMSIGASLPPPIRRESIAVGAARYVHPTCPIAGTAYIAVDSLSVCRRRPTLLSPPFVGTLAQAGGAAATGVVFSVILPVSRLSMSSILQHF